MKRTITLGLAGTLLGGAVLAAPAAAGPDYRYDTRQAAFDRGFVQGVRYDDDDDRRYRGNGRDWRREARDNRRDELQRQRAYRQGLRDGRRYEQRQDARDYNGGYYNDGRYYGGNAYQYGNRNYWRDVNEQRFYENRWNGRYGTARNGTRFWQGNDGRYYCRRNDGTTGLIIGALGGGTLGNIIAGRGDKLLGSVIGGAAGAILGRELDRGNARCR